jgi:hypothetical protein
MRSTETGLRKGREIASTTTKWWLVPDGYYTLTSEAAAGQRRSWRFGRSPPYTSRDGPTSPKATLLPAFELAGLADRLYLPEPDDSIDL